MVFGQDNDNFNNNESIFGDGFPSYSTKVPKSYELPQLITPQTSGIMDAMVKILGDTKNKLDASKFRKQLDKLIKQNQDLFDTFEKYGCKLIINENEVAVEYPKVNLKGQFTLNEDGTSEPDENAKQILKYITKKILNSEKMSGMIDDYDEEGFYPVGELRRGIGILDGKEVTMFSGILINAQGETKAVYFLNGKEVFPTDFRLI